MNIHQGWLSQAKGFFKGRLEIPRVVHFESLNPKTHRYQSAIQRMLEKVYTGRFAFSILEPQERKTGPVGGVEAVRKALRAAVGASVP